MLFGKQLLFLGALLAVQAELEKNGLKIKSSTPDNYLPLETQEYHFLTDPEIEQNQNNENDVQPELGISDSKHFSNHRSENDFPNDLVKSNSIQGNITYSTNVQNSPDRTMHVKEMSKLPEERYEKLIESSQTSEETVDSKQFLYKETRYPNVEQEKPGTNKSFRYFGLNSLNTGDFKIDPVFEHLPQIESTSENFPNIDPEFEHLPKATEYSNSPSDDWQYEFSTLRFEDSEEDSETNNLHENLQRSEASSDSHEHLSDMKNRGTSDEEYYYFDDYVDDASVSKTKTTSLGVLTDVNSNTNTQESNSSRSELQDTFTDASDKVNVDSFTTETKDLPAKIGREAIETASDSPDEYEEYDYNLGNDLIHHTLKNLFFDTVDDRFRSLVFNPTASPHEKFQECTSPTNETGHCRYVQHCFLPNIIASLGNFMSYVCVIQERFIGICCPEFPVYTVEVKWKLPANQLQVDIIQNITQPEGGCGVSSKTRIVGGTKADPKEWPWMAALLSKTNGHFFCGGALINSKYVLTAAHCTFSVPRNQILVRLGEYDFSDANDGPGEDYPVVEIKRHAQYSRKTLRNDIALLKLARSATFGPFVSTICLPESNARYVGQMATLAGWGNIRGGGPTSKILLEASFPVWSNSECSTVQGVPIRNSFICAGARTRDKGACNGDSGGPLMLLDESTKRWKAIGVVSWGRRGCDTKFPTVFSRVSNYLRWIEVHSRDLI